MLILINSAREGEISLESVDQDSREVMRSDREESVQLSCQMSDIDVRGFDL